MIARDNQNKLKKTGFKPIQQQNSDSDVFSELSDSKACS